MKNVKKLVITLLISLVAISSAFAVDFVADVGVAAGTLTNTNNKGKPFFEQNYFSFRGGFSLLPNNHNNVHSYYAQGFVEASDGMDSFAYGLRTGYEAYFQGVDLRIGAMGKKMHSYDVYSLGVTFETGFDLVNYLSDFDIRVGLSVDKALVDFTGGEFKQSNKGDLVISLFSSFVINKQKPQDKR